MNEKIYYVYCHTDPVDGEIVYYGHGCRERAWVCRPKPRMEKGGGGHRAHDHAQWCRELMEAGLTPGQWVTILHQGLSKKEARAVELDYIKKHPTRFNKDMGLANVRLTKELVQNIRDARDQFGTSYSDLSTQFNCSAMTAHRICNGEVRTVD